MPQRISQRVSSLQPTAVNSILAEVRELAGRGEKPVSLMRGEPDLATPPHIVAAANEALASGRTGYPNNQGEPSLREAVSKQLQLQTGLRYSADDEVLITTGATLGIYAALAAVLNPGDEVLIPEPIYDAYHGVIAIAGGVTRSVPAQIVADRFTLEPSKLTDACGPRSKAILINTPWNPTGTVLRRDELEAIQTVAEQHDLIVISDEIYEGVVYDGHQHVSPVTASEDARQRTIIVNSLSKTYAMTGWRLGYCAGPADLIRAMYLILQQSSRGPATFVQDAGVAALTGAQDCVVEMCQEYARRRTLVCDVFADLKNIRVLVPEAGFFAMLDVSELAIGSDDIRRKMLNEFGVVVVHGAAYGPSAEGTLRVSFASGGDTLATGLKRLREGLIAMGA